MTKVFAYIDETGDRGSTVKSSPVFGMAAVLVAAEGASGLRAAVNELRRALKVPTGTVLSSKSHVKTHDRRRLAAQTMAAVPGIKVCYVYAKKDELQPGTYKDDRERFYNYVALKIFKSIVWAAQHDFRATELHVRFGHVRHHDHRSTASCLSYQAPREKYLSTQAVKSVRWVSADKYVESQAADLFGGFLKAAVWPAGEFAMVEPSYLTTVWPLIRNADTCAIPLGIMSMPTHSVLTSERWFPCGNCEK